MYIMLLTEDTIKSAFAKHFEIYANEKSWSIPYHVECWIRARIAFDEPSIDEFKWLYEELKNRWQVFRGAASACWKPKMVFDKLHKHDQDWQSRSLSNLCDDNLADLWSIIKSMVDIKPLKHGPSVVAISKFLHFWNPRLFIIVDDAVMWRWVLAHHWLKKTLETTREQIIPIVEPDSVQSKSGESCDLLSYLAILRWSAEVVKTNPIIKSCFAEYVQARATNLPSNLAIYTYEAAAMEWFLLGVVELVPPGVSGIDS